MYRLSQFLNLGKPSSKTVLQTTTIYAIKPKIGYRTASTDIKWESTNNTRVLNFQIKICHISYITTMLFNQHQLPWSNFFNLNLKKMLRYNCLCDISIYKHIQRTLDIDPSIYWSNIEQKVTIKYQMNAHVLNRIYFLSFLTIKKLCFSCPFTTFLLRFFKK